MMRSVHMFMGRLVRTGSLLSPPWSLPASHLWPTQALHDFGDPDKFGDLKVPAEKPKEQPAKDNSQSTPSTLKGLDSPDGFSGQSGLNDHYHTAPRLGPAADNGLWDTEEAQDQPERGFISGHVPLSPPEDPGHPCMGQRDHLSGNQLTPGDRLHPTEPGASQWTGRLSHVKRHSLPLPTSVQATDTSPVISPSDGDAPRTGDVVDWDLEPDDAEDVEAERLHQVVSQIPKLGISCHAYGRKFKRMAKNGKLREALELFENQMLMVDKVQPDAYCYNVLISGCAQAGYTKMAFKLYRDMRRRRLKVKHVAYTSLLNACANGPSPADGLRRIQQLTAAMAERGYMMNVINYQALIKAYGRCGELQRAFETADELLQLGHPLTAELASFLLQACISDAEEGFRHALLVWHKLRSKRVEPSVYLYNLILRAALDCGAGDTATFEQAMQLILSGRPSGGAAVGSSTGAPSAAAGSRSGILSSSGFADSTHSGYGASSRAPDSDGEPEPAEREPHRAGQPRPPSAVTPMVQCLSSAGALQTAAADLPDLLGRRPHLGGLVRLKHLDTAAARLAVLGGWAGLLQTMATDSVQPDIKTFSLLLNTMPNQPEQEESLLKTMDALGLKPDVGFFNQLMKKRASYRNTAGAKAAFSLLESRGLQPDVASYGCLAMTVRDMQDMDEFMNRLKDAEVRPNVEVLTTLLNSAVRSADVQRALAVMEAFVAHQVRPDRRALLRLEELRLQLQTLLLDRERGQSVPPAARRSSFPDWVRKFRLRYAGWLAETETETEQHPHRQYRARPLTAAGQTGGDGAAPPPPVPGPAADSRGPDKRG